MKLRWSFDWSLNLDLAGIFADCMVVRCEEEKYLTPFFAVIVENGFCSADQRIGQWFDEKWNKFSER